MTESNADVQDRLLRNGFAVARSIANKSQVAELIAAIEQDAQLARLSNRTGARYAARNLLSNPAVVALCRSSAVDGLLGSLMEDEPFPVRAVLFDKVEGANWRVSWHQDLMIPVRERIETPGFSAWNVKAGVPHVKPPAGVLERMLTLRLHLDDCEEDNGPLEVLPGTHALGVLPPEEVQRLVERPLVRCTVSRGDAVLMRPLLLHASSKAAAPRHRRVPHVEFACERLPGELNWPMPPVNPTGTHLHSL